MSMKQIKIFEDTNCPTSVQRDVNEFLEKLYRDGHEVIDIRYNTHLNSVGSDI